MGGLQSLLIAVPDQVANAYLAAAARLEGVNETRELHYGHPVLDDASTSRGLRNVGNTCYGNATSHFCAEAATAWCTLH